MSSVSKDLSFVDTNVLVYAFDKSPSPKKAIARVLLNRLMEDDSLRVSTQVLQELFVTSHQESVPPLLQRGSPGNPGGTDRLACDCGGLSTIWAAIGLAERAKISFWDGLIVAAAARSGAAVLYTEDLNDGQEILGVRISNPFAG